MFSLLPKLMRLVTLSCLLLLPLALSGCAAEAPRSSAGCGITPIPCLQNKATVVLETSKGPVTLQLDGTNAPLTAGNFVDLVRRGTYNGTVFHRVVREPVPFVVQGGDPQSADPKVPASQYGTGSFIDPANGESRMLPLELRRRNQPQPSYGEVISSPTAARDLELTHERGAVAMARSRDANSASSQFYIALEALPELDGNYAVFGRVVQGMEVVDRIQQGDKLTRARLEGEARLITPPEPRP
jgi:peptidyl-prolyl cis-trans isomerase B (cyclophilin B)